MKILLLGKNGQVGRELGALLSSSGELVAMGSDECDFSTPEKVRDIVRSVAPELIINAAAYTNVDKAESEPELAHLINAETPSVLANEAKRTSAWLVHYSTDYVFDGTGQKAWSETDTPHPINTYGKTKFEGERSIQDSGCKHLIFRTSWIFAKHGHNFVKTIIRLAQERESLTIVSDQIGAPTGAEFIAKSTLKAISLAAKHPELSGLYHLAASGEVSWYDYARFVVECATRHGMRFKATLDKIQPISSNDYPTPATRPHNSSMNTNKLKHTFGIPCPEWTMGVEAVIAGLAEKHNSALNDMPRP